VIIVPQPPPTAPLWKKIFLHAKERIQSKLVSEQAANWVKIPYTIGESWRALAYAIIQTEGVDPEVKRFVADWANKVENGTKIYLRNTHGDAIFSVTPGLSDKAFRLFYTYLSSYQQTRQSQHLQEWDDDHEGWTNEGGSLGDDPDGPPTA
jgi:hypothetical protein